MSDCRCGRPTRDQAFVCDTCLDDFTQALNECPWAETELDITSAGQRGIDYRRLGGSPSSETPIPVHAGATQARDRLIHGLSELVRFCASHNVRHQSPRLGIPEYSITDMSRWLLWRVDGIALHDHAPDVIGEITGAINQVKRTVDRRAESIYLGPCDGHTEEDEACDGTIYARQGSPLGHCRDCGHSVDVDQRQDEINARLEDQLCTPAEIARYAVHLGLKQPREKVRDRVNYWHRHKRIDQRGTAINGDPTFRYGEIRPLLFAHFGEKIKS